MYLASGTRLGPYEILGALGAGGMGEVYKARDTRLDRTVAIKVLTSLSQADPDLRARFEREAKVLASFDHPHICALHDIGREGDIDFIVMPYVAGETLGARLAKGPMPAPEAIDIASQIADALDRAHAHGIVHRDLKPGNIMLTKTGARLLDFGLARLDGPPASGNPEDMATRSVLTRAGAVMGTVPYMSPEQLHGKPVDSRSDIWAFGCVLYEMIVGHPPFAGESDAALISAILRTEPAPPSSVRRDVPAALDEVVSGALAKDPQERWQNMRDVRRTLALASRLSSPGPAPSSQQSSWHRLAMLLLTALGIVLGGLAVFLWQRDGAPAMTRFDLSAPGVGTITHFTDVRPFFAASPDGQRIAFVATVEGSTDVWIKRLDGEKPELLSDTKNASSPFWSPDSQSIAFYADGRLKRKSLAGGPAQTLCEADSQGINGTWHASGAILYSEWGTRRILQVPENGGTPVVVRKDDTNPLAWATFLPDGRHYLFTYYDLKAATRRAFVGSLDSSETVEIPGVTGRAEFSREHLIFWREGGLVAQSFDLSSFQLTGQPVPLADDVHAFGATGFAAFSATPRLLVFQAGPVENRLVWLDRQGLAIGTVGPLKDYVDVRLSPDGRQVAFAARDRRLGTNSIFVNELDRDLTRPLTSDRGIENGPLWSPDGKTIVYAADRRGPPHLHARNADGSGVEREVVPPAIGPLAAGSFTPDGRSLVFLQPNPGTNYDVMIAPLDGSAPATAIVQSKGSENSVRVSLDGRRMVYASNESGRYEVYVQDLKGTRGRRQVSRDGGGQVRWRGDGAEVYFIAGPAGDHVMVSSITANGAVIESTPPRLLFVARDPVVAYDVTRDGQRLLLVVPDRVAERGTLSVVADWGGLLQK